MTARIAVLASGGGSNFQALAEHLDARGNERGGDVVVVASDRANARVLERARALGIETCVIATPKRPDATDLATLLVDHRIDLVVLAGYLRLVPAEVVRRFSGRMLNVHPALLPAFGGAGMYGLRVHQAVLDAGVRVTGVTAHFIDEVYDRGRIIAQWPVPVLDGDDAPTLAARVLAVEHVLFPRVVDAVAAGRIRHDLSSGFRSSDASIYTLADSDPSCLAQTISRALGL